MTVRCSKLELTSDSKKKSFFSANKKAMDYHRLSYFILMHISLEHWPQNVIF